MQIDLPYGKEKITIRVPSATVTEIRPRYPTGLLDEEKHFIAALRAPEECPPLAEQIAGDDKIAVVIPDITRALPTEKLLTWLFRHLTHVSRDQVVIIVGTGTHRPNTPEEIVSMVGGDIAGACRVVNHDGFDRNSLEKVGTNMEGMPIYMNREFVSADKRIIMGFIEPHFMAGFSGGYKAIFPGIADLDSIMHYHRAAVIGDPLSTWGNMTNNPTQDQVRYNGSRVRVDFCINVTLNDTGAITGFFCGDVIAAHDKGCAFTRGTAMVPCDHRFPLVITSNSGYPLDMNLYQAVKGMSAAAQIVEPGGMILVAARCNDGFPEHGNFRKLLFEYDSPQAFLGALHAPGFRMQDQWQNQLLALIQQKARVAVYSGLDPADLIRAHMIPVDDLDGFISKTVDELGPDAPIAVLPEGPMTIPYVRD